jgi:hypothetical protein
MHRCGLGGGVEANPGLVGQAGDPFGSQHHQELNATIARRLGLSPKTVRNYVSNIFAKLQVADRAQAVIRAREAGLGKGSS